MDSSGSFPGETLKELLQGRALDRAKITRVFDQIGIAEVIDELKNEHGQRGKEEESGGGEHGDTEVPYSRRRCGVRLVIIDSITGPYTAMVSRNQLQGTLSFPLCFFDVRGNIDGIWGELGQAMLVTIQRGLAALARDYGVAVLLLNDSPRNTGGGGYKHSMLRGEFEDASLRLLNGPTYAYGVDLHVLLSRHPEKNGEPVSEDGPDNVFEVLVDRCEGRGGRWAPFRVAGTQLVDW